MHERMVLSTVVLAATIMTAAGAWIFASRTDATDAIELQQPMSWVPFSAQVTMITPDSRSVGSFHRSSDGSTSMILETPGGPAITIHSVRAGITYAKLGDRDWTAHPITTAALKPPRPVLLLHSDEVKLLPERVAGLEVYERVQGDGSIARIVPALNGFLLSFRDTHGNVDEYGDVRLGEPPDNVFTPPAGARVRQFNRPFDQLRRVQPQ